MNKDKIIFHKNTDMSMIYIKIIKDFSYIEASFKLDLSLENLEFYESIDEMLDFTKLKSLIKENLDI